MYILYCKEEAVSKDYLKFIKNVREKINERYPAMKPFLKPEPKPARHFNFWQASLWRTLTMAVLNSMFVALSTVFIFLGVFPLLEYCGRSVGWIIFSSILVTFGGVLLAHLLIRRVVVR